MKPRKWSTANVAEAVRMFDAGADFPEIGERFGLTANGVRLTLRRIGEGVRYPLCRLGNDNGYWRATLPDGRRDLVHRLIMEGITGRRLEHGEIVHHRNERKRDNRASNLELMASISAHRKHHKPGADRPCEHCGAAPFAIRGGTTALCRPCFNHERRYHQGGPCGSSRPCLFFSRT